MSVRATALIPTHDHGPTLEHALRSAARQTVQDIEILVVGDGVPDVTRDLVARFAADDDRIRFFDRPKGPRHGEIHRHEALTSARGRIVCYLADDDLWLPWHLETMEALLERADFAHTLPVGLRRDGTAFIWRCDLSRASYRRLLWMRANRIPFSCAGHTLDAYRRLPQGWTTTPAGVFTDLNMWRKFLRLPGVVAVSGMRPSALHVPSDEPDWDGDRKLAWIADLARGLETSEGREALWTQLLAGVAADLAATGEPTLWEIAGAWRQRVPEPVLLTVRTAKRRWAGRARARRAAR